jgi:hypothetical protein
MRFMFRRLVLLSAPLLALVGPEVFENSFDSLRRSEYFQLCQWGCAAWFLASIFTPVKQITRAGATEFVRGRSEG